MLDINFIRNNPDKVREGAKKKGMDHHIVDEFLRFDEKWREAVSALDEARAKQNKITKEIAQGSPSTLRRGSGQAALREECLEEAKQLKERVALLQKEERELQEKREEALLQIPNLPFDDVPVGRDERENKELRVVGKKRDFAREGFEPKDHLALGEGLGILDFERGAKVAGSGFYYLKNEAALLELGLVRYALDILGKKGFEFCFTPDMAREKFYLGTGYLPRGPEAQTYMIEGTDLGLIATAEVTLAGLHADEVLGEEELPKMYAGYSHCFRQEAGAYGKYSKGLYRVHQFTKVEMFVYTTPEESETTHQKLLALEEEIWRGLGIPYRVLEMCAGDLGSQAARKYDLEAWMPGRAHSAGSGQGDWGEITSTSNTTDFQSRRLGIKYRRKDGLLGFAHTLNGTAIATPRAIVAILENYQKKDGSVEIPHVLRKYVGKKVIRRSRK
ncbi:MAG: serine--tRNA ligase [Nanoarchaeota archaeon]|nr:serine--tRNA ligase [Nanoarchaeota archaeon]